MQSPIQEIAFNSGTSLLMTYHYCRKLCFNKALPKMLWIIATLLESANFYKNAVFAILKLSKFMLLLEKNTRLIYALLIITTNPAAKYFF